MSTLVAWKQAAYAAGRSLGSVHMRGGLGITRMLEAGGASLIAKAGDKAACVGLPAEALIARVTAFHDERLAAVPDLAVYPELRDERDPANPVVTEWCSQGGVASATSSWRNTGAWPTRG